MGSPISPLGNVTNPLGDVIAGMLQGHQLGLQMQQQKNANADEQLRQALGQQQVQANDQAQREQIINNTRPVNQAGMVEVPGTDPRAMATTPGIAGGAETPNANGGGADRPTLQQAPQPQAQDPPFQTDLGLPPGSDPYTVNPPAQPSTPAASPVTPGAAPAAPGAAGPRLPQATPAQLPAGASGNGNVWVKADPNRLIGYKDSHGNVYKGELYTPAEQQQRILAAATAKLHVGENEYPVDPQYLKQNPDNPKTFWANPKDAGEIQKAMNENIMVPDPSDPTKRIRAGDLPKAREDAETARYHKQEAEDVQSGQENALAIAEANRKAREATAKATADGANARATERNKTVLQAAGIRAATQEQIAQMPARSTPASTAKDSRQAYADYSGLKNAEDALNTYSGSLAAAAGNGKLYRTADIDDKGKVTNVKVQPISDDPDTAAAQIADMKQQFENVRSRLKTVLQSKAEAAGRLGLQGTVPIDQQLSAIDAGTKSTHDYWANPSGKTTPPPAKPAPKATAAPAAAAPPPAAGPAAATPPAQQQKVASSAQVNAYALKKKITTAQAQQEFKNFGYSIGQ